MFSTRPSGISRAPRQTAPKNFGGVDGLAFAIFGGAAGTEFAAGEIENPSPMAALGHLRERAAAGLLHIVTVRCDCKNVQAS